jgi:hypothetical protein
VQLPEDQELHAAVDRQEEEKEQDHGLTRRLIEIAIEIEVEIAATEHDFDLDFDFAPLRLTTEAA